MEMSLAEPKKTLADFKRDMVVGSKWHAYNHFFGGKDMGVREVVEHRPSKFGFRNPETGRTSWCDWPKASMLRYDGNKAVIYCDTETNKVVLTYTKV